MAWSPDISTDYEAARECINHLLAIRPNERAREGTKAVPDAQVVAQLETDISRLTQDLRRLRPGTPEVNRIRRECGAMIRARVLASKTKTRPSLDEMLASFEAERHGGEFMPFAPIGREFGKGS